MKRIAALLAIALGTGMFMSAEDKSKGNEMTGTICDQKCVRQDAGKAACDLSCTETGGDAIFVDDQGKATKVANPAICEGKVGKKVKVHGKMMKNKDMQIYDVVLANVG
jgi:hypothetical protein